MSLFRSLCVKINSDNSLTKDSGEGDSSSLCLVALREAIVRQIFVNFFHKRCGWGSDWFHTSIFSNTLQHSSNTIKIPFKIISFFAQKMDGKKISRDFIKGGRHEVISQKNSGMTPYLIWQMGASLIVISQTLTMFKQDCILAFLAAWTHEWCLLFVKSSQPHLARSVNL